MKVFLKKVNLEIHRASEYLESNDTEQPDGFRVRIQSLEDSILLLNMFAPTEKSLGNDVAKTLADVESTLQNLQSGLIRAEVEAKLAASKSLPNSPRVKSTVQRNLVEIPTFSGDALDFRSFMGLFMHRVKSDSSLTDIEKFIILKNYLKGEAYDVIDEIPVNENNLVLALNLLEEMYGDRDVCISALIERIANIPAASTDNLADIRKTYWTLEASLRSVEQYNEVGENRRLEILYKLKFPTGFDSKSTKFCEFRKQVHNFVRDEEMSKKSISTAGVFTKEEIRCETGTIHENVNSSPTPSPQECKAGGVSGDPEIPSGTLATSGKAESTSNKPLKEDYVYQRKTHLTTVTSVECPRSGKKISVRLVMSSGTRSKVTENAVRRLGVKLNKNKKSSNAAGEQTVTLLIHVLRGPPVPVEFLVVETVCVWPVVTPTVAEFKKVHPHLADMSFPETGSGPLDMLIGGDTELAAVSFGGTLDCLADVEGKCPAVNREWNLASTMFGRIIRGPNTSDRIILFSV